MCSTLMMEGGTAGDHQTPSTNLLTTSHLDDSPPASTPSSATPEDDDDDDISVGCPSPALSVDKHFYRESRSSSPFSQTRDNKPDTSDNDSRTYDDGDDYFKPLKKLKMMQINKEMQAAAVQVVQPVVEVPTVFNSTNQGGVKSFSILDILNHRPERSSTERATSEPNAAQSRIVRPWDLGTTSVPPCNSLHRYHQRNRPKSADFCSYTSETLSSSSGRSSAGGSIASSDCCTSPDIVNRSPTTSTTGLRHATQRRHHLGGGGGQRVVTAARAGATGKGANTSPLDALFQMTSKTFDELNGEAVAESQANHLNLFNNRQNAKKKRKSRTAFTNHQIFELEKRFLYQKYLSPADRDEIAGQLGLSNAQVITWFQNRRAKLKRDLEELKKDVESVKVLTAHKSFLENVQDLGILKKKASPNSMSEDEKRIAAMTLSLAATGDKNL